MSRSLFAALILILPAAAGAGQRDPLTVDVVPLESLARRYYDDAKRIEVYYPKQYERLEMDWEKTVSAYLKQYKQAVPLQDKLDVFARLYYSWNNAHHSQLTVKGLIKDEPVTSLIIPIRIFGQGLRLSQARFFISDLAEDLSDPDVKVGDEVVTYDGEPIAGYATRARDETTSESPEAHIERIATHMTFQSECWWGKLRCWKPGEKVRLGLRDARTGKTREVGFAWDSRSRKFAEPSRQPIFPPDSPGWSYQSLAGVYAPSMDAAPEGQSGFLGVIERDGKKWLIIKIFRFHDLDFVQKAIQEARKPGYEGVILDFSENHGGDDSAMTLLGGALGTTFHLELSSIRLVDEFRDPRTLWEATFGGPKGSYLFPMIIEKNRNLMAPFTPFACLDKTCPMKTEYSSFVDYYDRPVIVSTQPVPHLALITGRATASKADSIAALFRATKIGPILGTPAVGSSGTYYFQKDYVVTIGKKAVTVSVTFTPDFSLAADCQEVQANPPQPDIVIERTLANRSYYDALTWISAATALPNWTATGNLGISCPVENAQRRLREFGLKGTL